jgi:hypothetical protein
MNQPPPRPRALTKEQIALLSRHAAEGAELQARQHNERVELLERQQAEAQAAAGPGEQAPLILPANGAS